MLKVSNIKMPISHTKQDLKAAVSRLLSSDIKNFVILKKSIDARRKDKIHYLYTVAVEPCKHIFINNKDISEYIPPKPLEIKAFSPSFRPVIVGTGPAGLFAALTLAKSGCRPIILERGKPANLRTKDVESFWNGGNLLINSNVQFGEGGAGTFSDGKINTGIKSPYIKTVLETFVSFGAPEEILYDSKPHIGTDYLVSVVSNIRQEIIRLGGEVRFETKLIDINIKNDAVCGVIAEDLQGICEIETEALILAVGHSARDTFEMLYNKGVSMIAKPFSVGARIEHLQSDINKAQFGCTKDLPPADYKLSCHLKNGFSVYTFCMCPGGFVAPSASEEGGVVTNGYSLYKRDGKNANSALLVGISPEVFGTNPLDGINFQRKLEKAAFNLGGGHYKAPCQLVGDFVLNIPSKSLGNVSPTYNRGVTLTSLDDCLPDFVCDSMREGIKELSNTLKGFYSYDALLTGVETRSSSPLRIIRNDLGVSNINGLFPCGEGSGYAGGIMSSAIDGIKSAQSLISLEK